MSTVACLPGKTVRHPHLAKAVGVTVFTATCYWPSTHCNLTQKIICLSTVLNHNRTPFLLDSGIGVY